MNLLALPAFADNYIWMLHDGPRAVVVDPGDAAPVHAKLDELGLDLAAILVTHHHPDHVGGVDALKGDDELSLLGLRFVVNDMASPSTPSCAAAHPRCTPRPARRTLQPGTP